MILPFLTTKPKKKKNSNHYFLKMKNIIPMKWLFFLHSVARSVRNAGNGNHPSGSGAEAQFFSTNPVKSNRSGKWKQKAQQQQKQLNGPKACHEEKYEWISKFCGIRRRNQMTEITVPIRPDVYPNVRKWSWKHIWRPNVAMTFWWKQQRTKIQW